MATRSVADTPLLRVSRPVSACSRCRGAKVKCDGKLPACTACEKLGKSSECSSANDQFAKGKERSYVASLESRIEKLEKRLSQSKGRNQSVAMTPPPNTSTGSLETNGNSARGVVRPAAARKQEASDMDDLVSDFGFLAVNATSRDFYGFTSGMSFANLVLTPATLEEIPPSPTRPLPPRHALYAMTQRYLERIFVLLPFFSETALFASINSLYHRQGSDWDHWVLYMVLATSSASLSQGKGDTHHQDALAFAATALTKAERVLHPGSVMGVQAILFLVQFAMLQPDHFDSWYLIGVASRTMVDLGLHQDQAKHATSPDTELRRRVFHCVYSLDRSISMVLRRAFSFSDDSVSVALRSPPYGGAGDNGVTWESQLQKLDPAFHLLRMRRLQSAWYQELFQSGRTPYEDPSRHVSAYTDEMRLWWKSTPKSTPSWLRPMYELELLYSSVYVMSPSRRVASMSDRETVSTFEDCIAFSDMMVVALGDADTRSCYTPHEALRLYFIGDRFLDTIWKNQDRLLGPTRTPDNLSASGPDNASRSIRCIEQLTAMLGDFGRRWGRSGDLQIIFNSKSEVVLAMLRGQRRRSGLVAGGVDGAPSYETPPLT